MIARVCRRRAGRTILACALAAGALTGAAASNGSPHGVR